MSRSREGAWIEIQKTFYDIQGREVAPARERGLKYKRDLQLFMKRLSLPRGSVD